MICGACKNKQHEKCPGGTWCDCQHKHLPQNEKLDVVTNSEPINNSDNTDVQTLDGDSGL